MADEIGFEIVGDREVQLRLDELPQAVHDSLLRRLTSLTAELAARVEAAAPERTGKLRSEVASRVYDDRVDRIRGRVTLSGEFGKAAALEYGAHKRTNVAAHAMRLDHVFANRLAAPLTALVAAHSRLANIAATRFLRGPAASMAPEIIAELRQAIVEAAAEGA